MSLSSYHIENFTYSICYDNSVGIIGIIRKVMVT